MSNAYNTAKKAVSIAVTATTILWSVGVASLAPLATKAATPGQLIKMAGNPAVYYLGSDNKRYVFPNSTTFFTWYPNFSGVVTVSASELQSYAIGGNVTMRPGTKLAKITTDPKVYAVEPGGSLRWVTTEAIAQTLWGANWAKAVVDVPDAFFVNYKVGSSITGNTYPTGSLIKSASSPDVYYVDGSSKRKITSAGFTANNFNNANVVTATDAVFGALSNGSDITSQESTIWSVAGSTSTSTGTGLTVALASDTPASNVIADLTAFNSTLKVNLTAAADGSVNVTGLTVKRVGLSQDADFSGIGVYDQNGNRHGNFVTFADTQAVIDFSSNPIVVPAGQTVPVTVKANLADVAAASGTFSMQIPNAAAIKTNANVSGSFPITGNGFSIINGSASVGSLQVDDVIVATSTINVDIGVTGYLLSKFKLTAGSNEGVVVKRVRMFNNGTTDDDDIQNYKLVDPNGVTLATVEKASNRYVDFVISSGYTIPEGNSRDLQVLVDVKDGSTRTAQLNIQNDYDIEVYGLETGSGILATAGPTNDTSFPVGDTTSRNHLTVQAGSLILNKSTTSPTGEIGVNTPNQVIAIWDLEAKGEAIEVQRVDLDFGGTAVAGDLNGSIKLQTESGQNLVSFSPTSTDGAELFNGNGAGTDSQTLSSYLTIPSNTTVKVKLIVDTSSTISSGDTIIGNLGEIYFKRTLSNTFATASDDTFIAGNTMTATTNSLTVTSNAAYASQTLTAGQSDVKVGSFLLKTNNAEGINITSIVVRLTATNAVAAVDLSNLKLKRADTNVQIGNTIASPVVAAAANTFTVNGQLNIPANTTVQVDVYANVASGASNGGNDDTLAVSLNAGDVSGVGASSGATIPTSSAATLQTLTFAQSGTLAVSIDQSGAASSQFYTVGLAGVEMARVKLATTTEAAKIQKLELRTVRGGGNVDSVKLLGTGLATDPVTSLTSGLATFTFSSGNEIQIPAQSSRVLTVVVNTTPAESLIAGSLAVVGLNTIDAIGSGSGVTIQETPTGTTCTVGSACGTLAAGDLVYTTTASQDGVAAGYYVVTALADNTLDANGDVTLNGTATEFAANDLVTELTATSNEVDADNDSNNALAVGDVVYFYGDVAGTDNSASTGWHVVTTASAANAGTIVLDGSNVAVDSGDIIVRFANASTANAMVGRVMRFEQVEPVLTVAASSPSGVTSPNSEQTVGVFNLKAEGGRDLTFRSFTVEKNGSNNPYQYVTKLSLWNGTSKLSEVLTTTLSGTTDDGDTGSFTISGTTIAVCSGVPDSNNDLGGISSSEFRTLRAGDRIRLEDDAGTFNTITISSITDGSSDNNVTATCDGTDAIVVNTAPTGITADKAITVYNHMVHFDANQNATGDTALSEQTVTQGQTMTLTVKADTSAVKTGVTSGGTATFGVNIPGSTGPLSTAGTNDEGLEWDYTPLNSGTATYKSEADNYPVIGNTLTY